MVKNITFSSEDFSQSAKDFFATTPETQNDLPTIRLLLFLDPQDMHYVYYCLQDEPIRKLVEHSMEMKDYIPAGMTRVGFRKDGGRIKLAEDFPCRIDKEFDYIEVLNATVPYLMRDIFNYKLDDVRITDLASFVSLQFGGGKTYLHC
jgi:hypothetical protein